MEISKVEEIYALLDSFIENCKKILKTNCDLYAVCSGVWNFKEGPLVAVNLFNKILNKN